MTQKNYIKLPRLYIDQALASKSVIELVGAQSHYLKNVLRKKPGDSVRVFNGQDGEWLAEIEALDKKSGRTVLKKQMHAQPPSEPPLRLIFAPIKKDRMDFLIEKATELGVSDFYPVLSARGEARKINEERIRAQIIEAAEQCERMTLPVLHPLQKLPALLAGWSGGDILWCLERTDAPSITELKPQSRAFLVGPEGGFDDGEVKILSENPDVRAVSLGKTIYRAETACLMCLTHAHLTQA